MLESRYYNNKEEFLNQMTMDEKFYKDGENTYSNFSPKTIQRFLWLHEYYWDSEKNEPVFYPMNRGLFITTLLYTLSSTSISENDLEKIVDRVNGWKYK